MDLRVGPPLRRLGILAIMAGLLLSWADFAGAQARNYTSMFLPARREMRQILNRARQAIDQQRYAEAVGLLGEFLQNEQQEDYFNEETAGQSIKSQAQEMLLGLPRAARESYELQFGREAAQLLQTALEARDQAQVAEVMRQFFATKAASEAALVWGRAALDAGDYLAAARVFERLRSGAPHAAEFEPELSLLTAVSWRLADQPVRAEEVLLELKASVKGAPLVANGQPLELFTEAEGALPWLDAIIGERPPRSAQPLAQWTLHRGDATRNAALAGSAPITSLRWRQLLGTIEAEDEAMRRIANRYQSDGIAAIPALSPLVIDNTVLMRTPDRLLAVDLQTGKLLWRHPWKKSEEDTTPGAPLAAQDRERKLAQRVWEDMAYGQMASDGKSVFVLDELGYAGLGHAPSMFIMPGGARIPNNGQPSSTNKLTCLSLQGKLKWAVGGESGDGEPELAGAFYLGAPLVANGQLYVLVELQGELRLVVLDPATGHMQWSQQLAHIERIQLQIASDSTRRLSGATPSMASGILVCPTSASSVVGVDLAQRKLAWGYRYEVSRQLRQSNTYVGVVQPPRPVGTHFIDATATIADGKVLLTPSESDQIICLDLLTGQECWKPIERADNYAGVLYVACVHDGRAILVGQDSVQAIQLTDGRPAWNEPLALEGALPSGRGFYDGRYYFLPTTQATLLKIDLSTGAVVQEAPTGRILGNLVCHDSQLISQNYDGVTAFYESEALRQELAQRLERNPRDPSALAQRGQLQLYDGQTDEALASLRAAHDLDPSNDDTRALLVQTLLAALRRDFTSYRKLAAEIEPLLEQTSQHREFLKLKAQGLLAADDRREAFETLVALAHLELYERPGAALASPMETFEPQLRLRFDRWTAAQMASIYRAAEAALRTQLDAVIAAELARLPADRTAEQLQRAVNYFGWHPLADELRVGLARFKWEGGDLVVAEGLLTHFDAEDQRPVAGQAAALLAAVYEKAGRFDYAARQYAKLREQWSDVVVRGKLTGAACYEAALRSPALARQLKVAAATWPRGKVVVDEGGDVVSGASASYANYQRLTPIPLVAPHGALADGSALVYDSTRRQLLLRDNLGNKWLETSLIREDGRATSANLPQVSHAHALGHLVIFFYGEDIVAFDMLKPGLDPFEAIRWRQDLIPGLANNTVGYRQVRPQTIPFSWSINREVATSQPDHIIGDVACVSPSSVCFMRQRDVLCLDPLTGETLWERTQLEAGSELFGDAELLFVVTPRSDMATVIRVADGQILGRRKVDRLDNRWTTRGRIVLSCKQDGREFVVRLFDAWSEETLWTERFAFGSRGALVGEDALVMMQPDGRLVIRALADGRQIVEQQVEPESKLMNIYALGSSQQIFVQMDTIIDAKDALPATNVQPTPGGESTRLVTGRLYAFDRATGAPSWQTPAYVSQHGFPLDQPRELPLLTYLRHRSPTTGRDTQTTTSVLCLDRRDGSLVVAEENIRMQQINVYEFIGNRLEDSVTLTLTPMRGSASAKHFRFRLTDQPAPPAPPAQMGAKSSVAANEPGRGIFSTFGRILGNAIAEPGGGTPAADDLFDFSVPNPRPRLVPAKPRGNP